MKVVGFVGSPKKEGNTSFLVETLLSGAAQKGSETEIVNLNELNIRGCQSCYHCRSHNECCLKDDMQKLYNQIIDSDAIVIGSPVYMWQMTSQTKAFIDRLFVFFGTDLNSEIKGKQVVLAFTQGNPAEELFQAYFEQTASMLRFLGFDVVTTIVSAGNQAPGSIKSQKELLVKAEKVGSSLVK